MSDFPKLSAAALEALERVRLRIVAEPLSLDMHTFVEVVDGTATACIAGHLALLEVGLAEALATDPYWILQRAADVVGLPASTASDLFHTTTWPERYRLRYERISYGGRSRASAAPDLAGIVSELLLEVAEWGGLWWVRPRR